MKNCQLGKLDNFGRCMVKILQELKQSLENGFYSLKKEQRQVTFYSEGKIIGRIFRAY